MKPEEAIKAIKSNMPTKGTYTILTEALELAMQALEKQVPKKPNTKFYGDGSIETVCPECEANIEDLGDEYSGCPYCLQKIDWSEDHD